MHIKFFAATPSRWTMAFLTVAVAMACLRPVALMAQQPPSPTPSPTPKPHAYVRFWNMLIAPDAPDLQLLLTQDRVLTSAQPADFYASYIPVDPASYNFTVCSSKDPKSALKRLPVILRADVYITLLAVTGKDGKPDVQLIDDTINPKTEDGFGKLVVRQFFPGANVTVSVGKQLPSPPLAFGETVVLQGLPIGDLPVTIQATGLPTGAKSWVNDVDFTQGSRHATLLVVPDPYGRFRPRLAADGSSIKPVPGKQATP